MTKRTIKRPRFSRRPWAVAIILLALLVLADRNGWLLAGRGDDMAAYHGVNLMVTRVIDGDTIEVDRPDALDDRPVTRVRLIGVDCPEPARRDNPGEPWADAATALTRSLAMDEAVTLRLEPHRTRGTFGRVLAHVELADGTSLNEALLAEGLAVADDRWPHTMLTRYAQVENAARRRGVGIWSEAETPKRQDVKTSR